MHWFSRGAQEFESRIYDVTFRALDIKFQSLIEDGLRAQFSFSFEYTIENAEISMAVDNLCGSQGQHFKDMLIEMMTLLDPHFEKKYWHPNDTSRYATLGYRFDETQFTRLAVDIGRQTCSFDWKAFLNDFYQTISYVQAQTSSKETIGDLVEQSLKNLRLPEYKHSNTYEGSYQECMENWTSEFGEEDDDSYTEAWFSRLRSVHDQAGLEFGPNNFYNGFDEAQVRTYRRSIYAQMGWVRNYCLFEDYCCRHKITEPLPDFENTSTSNSNVAVMVGSANEVQTVDSLDDVDQEGEAELDE
jgi:hypothetical protein